MALKATALTTVANLTAEHGAPADARSERIIERATAWIESMTGRKLKARNYNGKGTAYASIDSEDYMFFGGAVYIDGRPTLFLPQYPVVSGGSALTFKLEQLSGRTEDGDTFTELTANVDYILDAENGIVTFLVPFVSGVKTYRITCTAGYTTVPDDLEQLCLEVAGKLYNEDRNLASESIGGWSRSYKDDPYINQSLSLYRRFTI